MIDWLFDFLYPPRCPGCGQAVHVNGEWCRDCYEAVAEIREITGCPGRFVQHVWTLSHYDKGMKQLLHDVKFNKKKERSRGVAPFLYSFYHATATWQWLPDYVIPIPVSERKRELRGYNQVDLLFKPYLSMFRQRDIGKWHWLEALVKLDSTRPMWGLTKRERQLNTKGAFLPIAAVKRSHILNGKSVLLLDDIYTTGATVSEAADVLAAMGADSVNVLTLASGR